MARTIYWDHDSVVLIDQNRLPLEETYRICRHYQEVIAAINDLTIRGAPAIGVAAAMGIALGISFPGEQLTYKKRGLRKRCGLVRRISPLTGGSASMGGL
jgi:methylthioribose-1-phosphate isomerase